MTTPPLRAEISAEIMARSCIDEPMIERLVRRFYDAVRGDALLAPIVVWINYAYRVVYVRFVGTHRQYDAINAQTI